MACLAEMVSTPAVLLGVQRVEAQLNGRGRVLLRPSGTEPVVRVMIEGEDLAQVNALTEELAEIVANAAATK